MACASPGCIYTSLQHPTLLKIYLFARSNTNSDTEPSTRLKQNTHVGWIFSKDRKLTAQLSVGGMKHQIDITHHLPKFPLMTSSLNAHNTMAAANNTMMSRLTATVMSVSTIFQTNMRSRQQYR